jgi:hypothetical protein
MYMFFFIPFFIKYKTFLLSKNMPFGPNKKVLPKCKYF